MSSTPAGAAAGGLAVVLGARGGIGSAVLAELVRLGIPARAVGRSIRPEQVPAGVATLAADVSTADGAAAAVRGAAVVYHCVQPPYTRWTQEFPALNRAVVDAVAAAGAKLVFADNLYRYGPAGRPLAEDLPFAATDPKGRLRAAMATQLLAAHEAGRLRVTLGLASDYFGPSGVDSGLGAAFFGRLVAGKKAQWIGRLDQPHAASYLPDVGRGLVTLGRRDEADGRAWHLPAAAPTGRELLRLTGEALGRPATAQVAPRALLRAVGVVRPMFRELAHVAYQWERPWVVDSTAYERAFGPAGATPLPEAVGETVRWWEGRSSA